MVAAKLLDKVPVDVFDGKPLRYRKTGDGVVVFSVGPAGTYLGDALDADAPLDPRYEFRLWAPDKRRQPAPPQGRKDD